MPRKQNTLSTVDPNQLKGLISASYQRNGQARNIGKKQGYKLVDKFSNAEHKILLTKKETQLLLSQELETVLIG